MCLVNVFVQSEKYKRIHTCQDSGNSIRDEKSEKQLCMNVQAEFAATDFAGAASQIKERKRRGTVTFSLRSEIEKGVTLACNPF
jgi:hypothetical protein